MQSNVSCTCLPNKIKPCDSRPTKSTKFSRMSTFSFSPVSPPKKNLIDLIRTIDHSKSMLINSWLTCLRLNNIISMRWALWRLSLKGKCSGKMMRSGPLLPPGTKSVNFMSKGFPKTKYEQKMSFKEWNFNFFLFKSNPKTKSTNWPHCWTKNATAFNSAKTQRTSSKRHTSKSPTTFRLKSRNSKGLTTKVRTRFSVSKKNCQNLLNLFNSWLLLIICWKRNLQERRTNCWQTENHVRKRSDFLRKVLTNWRPKKRRPSKSSIKHLFTIKRSSNHSLNSQSKTLTSNTIPVNSKDSSTKKTKKSSSWLWKFTRKKTNTNGISKGTMNSFRGRRKSWISPVKDSCVKRKTRMEWREKSRIC